MWVHSPGKKPFELPLRATGQAIIFAIISINAHQRKMGFWWISGKEGKGLHQVDGWRLC